MPPIPVFGNLGGLVFKTESMADMLKKIYNLHHDAKYVGIYDFNNPVVLLRDIELIKSITIKNFEAFPDHRSFTDRKLDPLLGGGLFMLKGEEWKDTRNQVTPTFTSSKLKGMFALMSDIAIYFTDYLYRLPEKERELELKTLLTKYTNDVIATCVFGIAVNSIEDPKNAIYVNGRNATNITGSFRALKFHILRRWTSLARLLDIKLIPSHLSKFFEDLIEDTMNHREANGIYRPDMLQSLMETKKKNTTIDVPCHAFSFFFGGYDTVSSQACLTIYDLATNPEIQERLQQEIDQVLEKTQGEMSYDTIVGMEYLDAVLNESMRLHPTSFIMDRMCAKDFELPPALPGHKSFTIRKGMSVWIPIYAIQCDPNHFQDPDKFNPARFLQDGKRIVNSGKFFPFGAGPRSCAGNRFAVIEIKILLFHLFARCVMKPCSKTTIPLEMSKGAIILTAANGFWLKVEPREHVSPFLNSVVPNGTSKTE
ncbi:Cytochrome P450 9e2 [Dufourea novaeangliae]|uniref:Cytochrome P450 9e2 n=2 Tax=Dufourea novaeangliae TaxID=178035 RepID=A0A154P0W9_DUFNO|nr:Cytochrome P450 9e2 [Dufourea novaeangliae]